MSKSSSTSSSSTGSLAGGNLAELAAILLDERKFRFEGRLSREDWIRWLPTARSYLRKGGKGLLLDLMDVSCHRALSGLLRRTAREIEQLSNEEFIAEVTKALLPQNTQEVIAELQKVRMTLNEDLRASVSEYVGAFEMVLMDLPKELTPPVKRVVRLFIEGLTDETLRNLVRDMEPETLVDAIDGTYKMAEELRQARSLLRPRRGTQHEARSQSDTKHQQAGTPNQAGSATRLGSSSSSAQQGPRHRGAKPEG